jgi:hypothetical protein
MAEPTYEMYAVRYAHHDRRASENFIGGPFAGDAHDGPMPLDYFVWIIKGDNRLLAVDTGFDAAMAKKRERQFLGDPADTLGKIGIEAATTHSSRMRAITCRKRRWPTPPDAACATPRCAGPSTSTT